MPGAGIYRWMNPFIARQLDDALAFEMDGLERCFHKAPSGLRGRCIFVAVIRITLMTRITKS